MKGWAVSASGAGYMNAIKPAPIIIDDMTIKMSLIMSPCSAMSSYLSLKIKGRATFARPSKFNRVLLVDLRFTVLRFDVLSQ